MSKSFEFIEKEIAGVDKEIKDLEVKKDNLKRQLQGVCKHPKRYRTSGGEVCHKCGKTLKSWTPRIGNPI